MSLDHLPADWLPFAVVILIPVALLLGYMVWRIARIGGILRGAMGRGLLFLGGGREWCYRLPWLAVLGERAAGKSSLLASVEHGLPRQHPPMERALASRGANWAVFDRGLLIDVDGALASAQPGSANHWRWRRWLRRLERIRSQRPLDGVVLVVSAASLLQQDSGAIERTAEQCHDQLRALQRQFDFVLPVHVLISHCDALPGFDAFWRLQPETRRNEIVGWGSPFDLSSHFEADWVGLAFAEVLATLQGLLRRAAASALRLPGFAISFGFPQQLSRLEQPLARVLDRAMGSGAHRETFRLRGIYFVGALGEGEPATQDLRQDIAFVNDLVEHRLFREAGLAHPTPQGEFRRARLVGRTRLVVASLVGVALLGLGWSAARLDGQVNASISALALLQQPEAASVHGCVSSDAVYALLDEVARIDVDLVYPAIPASWFDRRVAERAALYVSVAAFEQVVFPSLACHLTQHGKELLQGAGITAYDGRTPPANAVDEARLALLDYVAAVRDFELNMARFQRISVDSQMSASRAWDMFAQVAEYAYARPLPTRVRHAGGQHVSALAKVANQVFPDLPSDHRSRLTAQLVIAIGQAKSRLDGALARGATLLEQLDTSDAVVDGPLLASWLRWVQDDWLSQGVQDTTVCAAFASGLAPGLRDLRAYHGYPPSIDQAAQTFAADQCLEPAMRRIAGLRASPYGALFVPGQDNYRMIPALTQELDAFADLANLAYMQAPVTQAFQCQPAPAEWHAQRVAEAAGAIREHQAFIGAQGEIEGLRDGAIPLYRQVARRALLGMLNHTMSRSQLTETLGDVSEPTWVTPISQADTMLAARSRSFDRALDSLLFVLRGYADLGFEPSRARLVSCLRHFATRVLGRIDDLAEASALYAPAGNPPDSTNRRGQPYFNLGGHAQASAYLKQELQRTRVLASYAQPFVHLLLDTEPVGVAAMPDSPSSDYWRKTISELNDYMQSGKPAGEVVNVQQLVEQVLVPLGPDNCKTLLAEYRPPPVYNDLFSRKRAALARRAKAYCAGQSL